MSRTNLLIAMLVFGLLAGLVREATAQTVEQFYKGRTINFLVASVPGGINDLAARLISRHLGRNIPGNPNIVVQNLQSSGLALANRIYNTPEKDGLLIAIARARLCHSLPSWATPTPASTRLKIGWLGSVSSYANDAYTLTVNATFHARTVDDLRKPDLPSAKIGTTGAGATNAIFANIMKDVLRLNIQHVRGYRGAAAVFLAQQRGRSTARSSGSPRSRSGSRRCGRRARCGH